LDRIDFSIGLGPGGLPSGHVTKKIFFGPGSYNLLMELFGQNHFPICLSPGGVPGGHVTKKFIRYWHPMAFAMHTPRRKTRTRMHRTHTTWLRACRSGQVLAWLFRSQRVARETHLMWGFSRKSDDVSKHYHAD
jgi:hypothetical protein